MIVTMLEIAEVRPIAQLHASPLITPSPSFVRSMPSRIIMQDACTAIDKPIFLPNPKRYVTRTIWIIRLLLSSRNISLKLIAELALTLYSSLPLKYISSCRISPTPERIAAVIRYSFQPTAPEPVIIQTTVMNTPEHASATDFSVFAQPAALLVSSGVPATIFSIPCDGISAIVMLTFQSIRMKVM